MKQRTFQMLETNGIRLRTVVEGSGPLVILLHGFPQCWYLWRHQIDPLVEADFQVAVPDQRGYGGSDRPEAIEAYNIGNYSAQGVRGCARKVDFNACMTLSVSDHRRGWGPPQGWVSQARSGGWTVKWESRAATNTSYVDWWWSRHVWRRERLRSTHRLPVSLMVP